MIEFNNDKILEEDIKEVANSKILNLELLKNKTIFITGATGLLGSQMVKTLIYINRVKKLEMRLVLLVKNLNKAQKVFNELLQDKNIIIINNDIMSPIEINEKVDYIIHGASPTSSKYFVEHPVETIDTIINGTKNMLELAKNSKVNSFIFLSSLEVYGKPLMKRAIVEDEYGYIDNLNIRSSYSEGKRLAECLCVSYNKEYGVPIKIARLSQTFGPGVEYNDERVFAQFIRSAIEKKNIILHTEGKTLRTYCYTKDAIIAILFLMLNGKNGEAYNVTNKNTDITIKEMAQLVCSLFPESKINVKIEVPEDIEKLGYNPEMVIRLDTSKIEKMGWKATTNLSEMLERTKKSIEYRKDKLDEENINNFNCSI